MELLPLAQELASLPKEALENLERPEYLYGLGWSHGREQFKGKPDFLKVRILFLKCLREQGSFYANPQHDRFANSSEVLNAASALDMGEDKSGMLWENAWPREDLPELRPAFKGLCKKNLLV